MSFVMTRVEAREGLGSDDVKVLDGLPLGMIWLQQQQEAETGMEPVEKGWLTYGERMVRSQAGGGESAGWGWL